MPKTFTDSNGVKTTLYKQFPIANITIDAYARHLRSSVDIIAKSIEENGVQTSIIIARLKGKYYIVNGRSILAAMKQLNRKRISAMVKNFDTLDQLRVYRDLSQPTQCNC